VQVNAVGAGLLLGSALCVILPEGFEAAMELHQVGRWATCCGAVMQWVVPRPTPWCNTLHMHS